MGRLIDADVLREEVYLWGMNDYEPSDFTDAIDDAPTVEAIPRAEVKKFLEEGVKNVGNNVLAIVREDYIHKADYENRLKADKVAMLTDLQLDIEGQRFDVHIDKDAWNDAIRVCSELIQQRINELKAGQ